VSGSGGDHRSRSATFAARERERNVVELCLRGATFEQVGRQLNIERSTAYKAWQRVLKRLPTADVETLRKAQSERLQRMRRKLWTEIAGRADPSNPSKVNAPSPELLNDLIGTVLANTHGLFVLKAIGQGVPPIKLRLADFTARIVAEVRRDDGIDSTREFEIKARLGGQTRRVVIAAAQFASMKWVAEQLGARVVIAAGMGIKDQVREAIQLLSSPQMVERTLQDP